MNCHGIFVTVSKFFSFYSSYVSFDDSGPTLTFQHILSFCDKFFKLKLCPFRWRHDCFESHIRDLHGDYGLILFSHCWPAFINLKVIHLTVCQLNKWYCSKGHAWVSSDTISYIGLLFLILFWMCFCWLFWKLIRQTLILWRMALVNPQKRWLSDFQIISEPGVMVNFTFHWKMLFPRLMHISYFSYTGKVKLLSGTDHVETVAVNRCFSLGNYLFFLSSILLNMINFIPVLKSYDCSFPKFKAMSQ